MWEKRFLGDYCHCRISRAIFITDLSAVYFITKHLSVPLDCICNYNLQRDSDKCYINCSLLSSKALFTLSLTDSRFIFFLRNYQFPPSNYKFTSCSSIPKSYVCSFVLFPFSTLSLLRCFISAYVNCLFFMDIALTPLVLPCKILFFFSQIRDYKMIFICSIEKFVLQISQPIGLQFTFR